MKKPLIAAIATLAVAAGAQAESKFYGKMNVSFNYMDSDPELTIASHASRLGVKGSEDLGSSKVIYQAEYQIDVADGYGTDSDDGTDTDTNTIKPRDTYIGLAYSGMGTVKMGIMDTPLKKSQGKFDLFNDVFDIKRAIDGDKRLANSLNYTTEKMSGIQASVSYILMEDVNGVADDGISANVTYKQGDIYAALAMDSKTEDADTATTRATVIYSLGDMRFGALVNIVDESDTAATGEELGYAVNGSMKMGKNTVKVQYGASDQGGDLGATGLSLGVDHKLGKATKAYGYVDMTDADAANSDLMVVAFGLEHKF